MNGQNIGFSLVELSIVLVILGLLVGGILAGQSLIRASELRKALKDIDNYKTAVHAFRDKYFALPGDMPNATSFWGDDPAKCASAATADGVACNGDGDGKINDSAGAASLNLEPMAFWEHLRLAGLIDGGYDGLTAATIPYIAIGKNVPQLANRPIGVNARGIYSPTNTGGIYLRGEGNFFQLGSIRSPNLNTEYLTGNSFNGEESWNMDRKMDDGLPGSGQLLGIRGETSSSGVGLSCTNPYSASNVAPPTSYNYVLDNGNSSGCLLYMRL